MNGPAHDAGVWRGAATMKNEAACACRCLISNIFSIEIVCCKAQAAPVLEHPIAPNHPDH
jgi:hypothetical protein